MAGSGHFTAHNNISCLQHNGTRRPVIPLPAKGLWLGIVVRSGEAPTTTLRASGVAPSPPFSVARLPTANALTQ